MHGNFSSTISEQQNDFKHKIHVEYFLIISLGTSAHARDLPLSFTHNTHTSFWQMLFAVQLWLIGLMYLWLINA